jgi:L-alanine-DL-glutamate epimerase-like enolase superfamily enzyme
VCNFASLHAAAVAPVVDQLEFQLGESVLFFEAVQGVGPRLSNAAFAVPMEPGLGLTLDPDVVAAHPYAPVPIAPDPRLG